MGLLRITIDATCGHGCQREIKDGGGAYGCGRDHCPDCQARRFVEQLKARGATIEAATLTHWPGTPSEVRDNLVTGVRSGSF